MNNRAALVRRWFSLAFIVGAPDHLHAPRY